MYYLMDYVDFGNNKSMTFILDKVSYKSMTGNILEVLRDNTLNGYWKRKLERGDFSIGIMDKKEIIDRDRNLKKLKERIAIYLL